jgi:hypothetical protein
MSFYYPYKYTSISWRYSPYASYLDTERSLRRSRLAAELAASRMATEDAIYRSRVAAEVEADIYATERVLRRSRVEAEIEASSAIRRSRIAA